MKPAPEYEHLPVLHLKVILPEEKTYPDQNMMSMRAGGSYVLIEDEYGDEIGILLGVIDASVSVSAGGDIVTTNFTAIAKLRFAEQERE